MPYILARSSQIQNGSVQITDLFPNESQRNMVNDPVAQGPFYVKTPNLGLSGLYRTIIQTNGDGSLSFLREARGLVAYLIANVEADGVGAGDALTLAEAEATVATLLARVRAGQAIEVGDVNNALTAANGNATSLVGGNSTGTLVEVLSILAGNDYVVPAGRAIQTALGAFAPVIAPGTLVETVRSLVPNDTSWKISFSEGVLSGLVSTADRKFGAGAVVPNTAPLLTVYNDDGTLYVG